MMESADRQKHWENIYATKQLNEVSWYQPKPETSLDLIFKLNPQKNDAIIDIGGGDSFLVDHLLDMGFTNLTVLDISENAINRAKERLKDKADLVKWIVSDITKFEPSQQYDIWHDRAAFHFLTEEADRIKYIEISNKAIKPGKHLIIGTFSVNGPFKCSGIEIKQNNEESLTETFKEYFKKIKCEVSDHATPFNTVQNFIFCVFNKIIK